MCQKSYIKNEIFFSIHGNDVFFYYRNDIQNILTNILLKQTNLNTEQTELPFLSKIITPCSGIKFSTIKGKNHLISLQYKTFSPKVAFD